MDILKKIEEALSELGREVADKAEELAEIASLKSQIGTCEEVIQKNYVEIGKLYYELHKDAPEEDLEKHCRAIQNAKRGVADLQEKMKEIKGV